MDEDVQQCHSIGEDLPVFIGAEGVGTSTVAGRGGKIIKVTNLNDAGPGSLREAVNTDGARTVVFDVSGTINLNTPIVVEKPFITIAGQTSPNGIIVSGKVFIINTHDVLVRHLRFRTGTHNSPTENERDNLRALYIVGDGGDGPQGQGYYPNKAYNVVIDHNSFSWSTDQTLNVGEDAYDVTMSWNLVTEPLTEGHSEGHHGYNVFFWGKYTRPERQYSFHHNYLSHSQGRNPEINYNGQLDYRNNITYNTENGVALDVSTTMVNAVNNYYKAGPSLDSNNNNKRIIRFGHIDDSIRNDCGGNPGIFVRDNLGQIRMEQDQAQGLAAGNMVFNPFEYQALNANCFLANAVEFPTVSSKMTIGETYALEIVEGAGATMPKRDEVDQRVVNDFKKGTGSLRASVSYPEDWPKLAVNAPLPPIDSDNDGMADAWEIKVFGHLSNTHNGDDKGIAGSNISGCNGYTNIEEYFHSLQK